jgi:hypothetical protein
MGIVDKLNETNLTACQARNVYQILTSYRSLSRAKQPMCMRTGAGRRMRAGSGASGPQPKAAHESEARPKGKGEML